MIEKVILFLISIVLTYPSFSQNRNSVWCFGDSAKVDFSDTSNIIVTTCGMDSRGSCVSICNGTGQLLFYASSQADPFNIDASNIFDTTDNIMHNGDSIKGRGWYRELVIIPNPKNDSTYYLFTVGVTSIFGLYYNLIDLKLNNGLGSVIQKNIQLNSLEQTDCISAVKHGNGRDWWLITRPSNFSVGGANNEWHIYLITADSIILMPIQSIGQLNRTGTGEITFTKTGNRLAFTNLLNVLEIYDFDRCTGLLSNVVTIESDPGSPPYPYNWSCAFSSDETKLYISTNDVNCYLFQYDLNSTNITASKDTLWSTNYPTYTLGAMKLAPDNKIYLANMYYNGFQFPYPYADSVYNMYNMNLSVINYPDSLGTACNFQPYSFYLNGKRAYVGLPNNPDYVLAPLIGSSCDTIVSIIEPQSTLTNFHIFYSPPWQSVFINADNLKGRSYQLRILDASGREVHLESGIISSTYFTRNLNCEGYVKGMYVVYLETHKEKLVKKLVLY